VLTLLSRSAIYKEFMDYKDEKLGALMGRINNTLIDELAQSGSYITGILLRFTDSTIEYANSGHPDMIYRSAANSRAGRVLTPEGSIAGPFLGVDALKSDFKSIKMKLNRDDCLLLYTDGLSETKNSGGEMYEEKRISRSLKDAPVGTAREMLDHVMDEFYGFVGNADTLKDDLTAILIKKK
jgi:sigma-B regulation protein RsbU (phosphoserine phosphatase)